MNYVVKTDFGLVQNSRTKNSKKQKLKVKDKIDYLYNR